MDKETWTGLPDLPDNASASWERYEQEQQNDLREALGDPLYRAFVGRIEPRPIWHWEPVSRLVRWIGDRPVFETPSLDEHEPDWIIQVQAARRYLDNKEKETDVKDITPSVFIGLAILFILIGLIGLTVGAAWRLG